MTVDKKINRYGTLDGIRAYSAIGIAIMHVLENSNLGINGFVFEKLIPSFTNLVFLFMTVSAFCMCCGYYSKIINKEISVKEFYSKRYKRILPYFALLCVFDFIVSPGMDALFEVFANITLCFGLIPNADIKVIGVGWFLGLIFVFYIAFPFFCYLISDKRLAFFTLFCALIFNLACELRFDVGRENILYSSAFFVIGGIIYLYRDKIGALSKKYKTIIRILLIAAIACYYLIGAYIPIILALCAIILIFSITSRSKILQNRFTKFISSISMEIYLSHMMVYRVIEKLQLTHIFKNDVLSYILMAVITVVGTIVLVIVIQKFLCFAEGVIDKIKMGKIKNEQKT